jgi:hypothetical protein
VSPRERSVNRVVAAYWIAGLATWAWGAIYVWVS